MKNQTNDSAGVSVGMYGTEINGEQPVTAVTMQGNTCEEGYLPLYIRVCLWLIQTQRAVTRDDISLAFSIPARQAADIMTYITRQSLKRVNWEKVVTVHGKGIRTFTLRVTAVHPDALKTRQAPARQKKSAVRQPDKQQDSDLRNLFLYGRRNCGGAE